MKIFIRFAQAIMTLLLAGTVPAAETDAGFPVRPVTIIVPFAANGPSDTVARLIADTMRRDLGQPVHIENVVGAGGTTAAIRTMRAAPDGHTMILGHLGTHAAAVTSYPNLAYDPSKDFEPIGKVAVIPVVVVARKDFPANDLKELIARLKMAPARMGHAGQGSVAFATCTLFNSLIGVNPEAARFNGTAPAMEALAAGQIDYMCDQIVNVVPPVRSNRIKAFVLGTPKRNAALPDVPGANEAGLPGFQACAWNALFAPKGTPKAVVKRLNAALARALDDPDTRRQLTSLGAEIPEGEDRTPEALAELVEREIVRWAAVIKAAR